MPLHRNANIGARALPVRFEEVSRVKRPGKKATEEMKQQYRQAVKQYNLSRRFVQMSRQLRQELDLAGGEKKIPVFDWRRQFLQSHCFAEIPQRAVPLVRARRDSKLCFPAPAGSRRVYGTDKFTPEHVRRDETRAFRITRVFYGGKRRKIRYKEVAGVLWQSGARQRPLRLIVLAPTPYRQAKSKRMYYRNPAYLFTTDLHSSTRQLLHDRWRIEVNHREEKDTLGVGQAQLWNATSVPKQPVLAVAAYSALLLASLQVFGPDRGSSYAALPRWRAHARRPSCLDLITLLRKEVTQQPPSTAPFALPVYHSALVEAAAA